MIRTLLSRLGAIPVAAILIAAHPVLVGRPARAARRWPDGPRVG
ncbi:hypothetical protein [Methylobacterium planeticum]|nr:hypothetical protein [Methylobacterium planeticum]